MPVEPVVSSICAGPPNDEETRRIRHLASFPEKDPNPVIELDLSGTLTFSNPAADRLAGDAGAKDAAEMLAADFPAIRAELESAGGKAVERELLVKGQTYMASYHLVADPPRVQTFLWDITRQKRAEDALFASGKDLDLHNRIAEVYLTVPDNDMYTEVLNIVLAAFDSRLGVFGYIDEKGALVVPSMTRQVWDRCQVAQKTITFPHGTWGTSAWPRALREKKPVWSNEPSGKVPQGHVPILRHITMPVLHRGEAIGLFQVANRRTDYTEEDVRALRSIADHVAPVLHARLERDQRELARRQAEEALASSEQFLSNIIEQSPVSLWISDSEGTLIRTNLACRELFGAKDEEVVGKYNIFKDNLIEDQGFMPLVENVFEKGEIARFTIDYDLPRVRHIEVKGGTRRILNVVVSPIKDIHGKLTNALVQHEDITGRKRAEEALRLKNFVFDVSISANSIANIDGAIIEANNAFLRMWGFSGKEEVVGKPLLDFIQNKEEAVAIITALNSTGAWEGDYTAKRKDGSTFTAHGLATVLRDKGEKLIGYQSAVIDITASNRNETALQESVAKFRDTVQNLDEGYYSCSIDGIILDYNLAFCRILGIDPAKDMKGQKLPDFWQNPQDRKLYLKELMENGFIRNYPINAKKMNDEMVVVLASSHIVRDEEDKPVRIDGTFTDFTGQKRMQDALEESEAKYRGLFENAQIGMYRSTLDGSAFLEVNKKFAEILGFEREQLLGTPGRIRWADPDERGRVLSLLKERGGTLVNYETRVLTKDGDALDVVASMELHQEAGYLEGTMADISERKRAERTLRETEERFRIAAESATDIIWAWDVGSGALRWFGDIDRMLGYAPGEFARTFGSWEGIIHPDDRDRVMAARDGHIREESPYNEEYRVLKKDGGVLHWIDRGRCDRDAAKKPHHMIGSITDITEKKRVAGELEKYRRGLEKLVLERTSELMKANEMLNDMGRTAKVGAWEFDTETMIQTWTEEVFRIHEVDATYKPVVSEGINFYAPSARPIISQAVQLAIETGEPFDLELELITAKNHHRWVRAIGKALRENGKTRKVFGTFQDITDRKTAENVIRQRTIELEAMNRELESFSYSVSHDLRAPLRTMDGFSMVMMEDYAGKLDETGMDHLRRIRAATQRMAQLIDDLLKLSRVSRGELRIERADLGALARSVERELRKSQPGREVALVVEKDLVVNGDSRLLRVVMENLLSNAWKFTGKHPSANVTVGKMEKDGEIVFFVRDDGAGFDMAYVGRLFGPFQRLHSTEEFPGSGIGLATVQRIVHRHGGRIWAEGAVDKGATFCFTLKPKDNKNPTRKEKEAGDGK